MEKVKNFTKIRVEYDGAYPNACSGKLSIWKNGKLIYKDKYCCHSTGSVGFDANWDAHVRDGELIWNDADKFPKDVAAAVEARLSRVRVCCGGCI